MLIGPKDIIVKLRVGRGRRMGRAVYLPERSQDILLCVACLLTPHYGKAFVVDLIFGLEKVGRKGRISKIEGNCFRREVVGVESMDG